MLLLMNYSHFLKLLILQKVMLWNVIMTEIVKLAHECCKPNMTTFTYGTIQCNSSVRAQMWSMYEYTMHLLRRQGKGETLVYHIKSLSNKDIRNQVIIKLNMY